MQRQHNLPSAILNSNRPIQIRELLGLDSLTSNAKQNHFKKNIRVSIRDAGIRSAFSSTRVSADVSPKSHIDVSKTVEIM